MRKRLAPPESREFEDRQETEQDDGDEEWSQFETEEINLGDLTDDILRERGEDIAETGDIVPYSGGRLPPMATNAPDVRFLQKVADDVRREGVEGTVSQGARVTSTYDARPVNARDFISTNEFNVPAGA